MILWFAIAGVVLACLPTMLFLRNLPQFVLGEEEGLGANDSAEVSVLIPARDEQEGIEACVLAALASERVALEVLVLDDHSTDATATIVGDISKRDARVRCLSGQPLPEGWNGKQYACWQLASAAQYDRFVFIDADVRLRKDALSRLAQRQDETGVALLSAFPHQQTGTWLEKLVIPLMHYVLLGFLPLDRMRQSTHPAYASGCGQLFMTSRGDYKSAGTHAAIGSSRHDGLKLPRVFREAGMMSDVVDGTELAECRMYRNARQVIRGVLKNAHEGIANPRLIVPFSMLLLGGSVLPVITLIVAAASGQTAVIIVSSLGVVVGHLPRAIAAKKFRQPLIGVLLHGVGVSVFVMLQWVALLNHLLGRQIAWRGRTEATDHIASTT